jgi:WD40 repeat protein
MSGKSSSNANNMILTVQKDSVLMGSMTIVSPNGKYLASTMVSKVVLREISNISQISHLHQCLDKIEKIEFSPNSEFLLCGLYARNAIQIFSTTNFEWNCRINEGIAGIISCYWLPDSRTILTESDFGICLSLWSLSDEKHSIISMPKPSHAKSFKSQYVAFSDNHHYMVVVHRSELQDSIGLYSINTTPISELTKFKSRSHDIASISFLPKDTNIFTIDSPLHYTCCVYSPSGEVRTLFL